MRRISCLIVDDEPPIVQRLAGFFDKWNSQGSPFVLVGQTYSSREAVELSLELKPDIVITDIVMPELNGIELIKELKEQLPGTEFIILSAYSEFTYAKQAIAFNVLDYLVKIPLKEAEVYASLEKAREKLVHQQEQEQKFQDMRIIVKENSHRIRKQIIEELIRGDLDAGRMDIRAGEMVTKFQPIQYCCYAIRFDEYETFRTAFTTKDQKKLKYGMLNIIEETVNRFGHGFACELETDMFVAFLSFREKSASSLDQAMYQTGLEIQQNIKQYMKLLVSVGCSKIHTGWEAAGKAYRQSKRAIWDSFYYDPGFVVTQTRRLDYDESETALFRQRLRRIEDSLTPLSVRESRKALNELLQEVKINKVPPNTVLEEVKEFLAVMNRKLSGPTALSSEPGAQLEYTMHWNQMLEKLDDAWRIALEQLNALDIHPEMLKAIQFIKSNLAEPLSLSIVSEHVCLNANYFSELFKKEFGENFTNYINRHRIERAIQLMNSAKDFSNLELANAVGIQTEKYFCTLFKKYTGVSPQKYMKPKILK